MISHYGHGQSPSQDRHRSGSDEDYRNYKESHIYSYHKNDNFYDKSEVIDRRYEDSCNYHHSHHAGRRRKLCSNSKNSDTVISERWYDSSHYNYYNSHESGGGEDIYPRFNRYRSRSHSKINNRFSSKSISHSPIRHNCSRRRHRRHHKSSRFHDHRYRYEESDEDYYGSPHVNEHYRRHFIKRNRKRRHRDYSEESRDKSYSHSNRSKSSQSSRKSKKSVSAHRSRYPSIEFSGHGDQRSNTVIKDDDEGHLVYEDGDFIYDSRFQIIRTLGEGTFGKVVEARDISTMESAARRPVALKIIKNVGKYRDAAKLEINVLEHLKRAEERQSGGKSSLCLSLTNWFNYHGHICLAFELLGLSVFDFLKENDYRPYPLEHVRHIAYQLLYSVNFMHVQKLTHTDLKPENILFLDSRYRDVPMISNSCSDSERAAYDRRLYSSHIRLIDFGSATFENEHHSTTVSTRHYRAPEVILELGWSYPCDVWSIGCIVFELYTGYTLFQTHDNLEHLAMMERIFGALPSRMCRKSRKTKYVRHGRLQASSKLRDLVHDLVKPLTRYKKYSSHDTSKEAEEEDILFHLIESLLTYDPGERLTCEEAMDHEFFDDLHPSLRLPPLDDERWKREESSSSTSSSTTSRSHSISR